MKSKSLDYTHKSHNNIAAGKIKDCSMDVYDQESLLRVLRRYPIKIKITKTGEPDMVGHHGSN